MQTNHAQNTNLIWWARLIYGFVAANAFAGAFILILLPTHTDSLFFWPVNPPINAALFGALYLGGAAAVSLTVWRNVWEPARFLVPILVAAGSLISGITLLHLDKFATGVRLVYWLVVYIGAPLLAGLIYVEQERRGADWRVTVPVRPLTRLMAVMFGALVVAAGLLIIIWPETAVAHWPWSTSPLVVRIFAAWFAAFGVGLLWFWVERDWRRLRHVPNLMIAAAGLDLLVVYVYRHQITGPAISLWLYCGHLILFGLTGLLLHGLQYRYSTSVSLRPGEATF